MHKSHFRYGASISKTRLWFTHYELLGGRNIEKHDVSILDASLPAVSLYEYRGYKTVGHGFYELKNNVRLVYEIMEKNLELEVEIWHQARNT